MQQKEKKFGEWSKRNLIMQKDKIDNRNDR
jgi:hypothetical protein